MKKLFVLVFILLASLAYAKTGSEGVGGGDTINGDLIEIYGGHTTNELPGFDSAIKKIREFLPFIADTIAIEMNEKNIYLIPSGFNQLATTINDLNFNTELPCYQTVQELFCDINRLNKMTAEQQKNLFIHEAMVERMLVFGRTISDVRISVSTIINPNATPESVSRILQYHGLTDSQCPACWNSLSSRFFKPAEINQKEIEKNASVLCEKLSNRENDYDAFNFLHKQIKVLIQQAALYSGTDNNINENGNALDVASNIVAKDWTALVVRSTDFEGLKNKYLCRGLKNINN